MHGTPRSSASLLAMLAPLLLGLVRGAAAQTIDYTKISLRTIKPFSDGTAVFGEAFTRDGVRVRFETDQIYQASAADGSGAQCVTCGLGSSFSLVRQGASMWAESPDSKWLLTRTGGPFARFGFGQVVDFNVFALALDADPASATFGVASKAYPLTFGGHDETNLDPIFTPDGTQVIWWQNRGIANHADDPTQWKNWKIMIADFKVGADGPFLEDPRALVDPGGAFVEDGGISGDGRTYYYTKTVGSDPEIFALDMSTRQERRLTDQLGWDEFPAPSPNGEVVSFLSDRDRANPLCDPSWAASRFLGLPSSLDYLVVIPGSIFCAIGEGIPPEPPDPNRAPPIRVGYTNFDMYLMDANGQRIVKAVPEWTGNFGWSPDSTEAVLGRDEAGNNRGLDVPDDEIPILHFGN